VRPSPEQDPDRPTDRVSRGQAAVLARLTAVLALPLSPDEFFRQVLTAIAEQGDCRRLADVGRDKAGRVDVLVNGAGRFPFRPFEEMSFAEWREIIDINLTGAFSLTHAVLPLLKGRGWGRVINIGSASIAMYRRGA
jgi:NAD(P)-dependent dehydrogenase (short-subunit alcohol dehydrogenase family)